jgi:hypothetical protein
VSGSAGTPPPKEIAPKLIDPNAAMRMLRAGEAERDELIERYGLAGRVELEIADELSNLRPLADPEHFAEAHRRALYAIEVLDRNGARQVRTPRIGPLAAPAGMVIGLITRSVVRGHQAKLVRNIRRMCERREAVCDPDAIEHALLRRARFHTAMVDEGYHGNSAGLPAFLVGGALVSGVASGVETAVFNAFGSRPVGFSLTAVVGVILLALSWCALSAAGVARRRIRLTVDAPMRRLWEAVGAYGRPPKDQSFLFAILAIALALAVQAPNTLSSAASPAGVTSRMTTRPSAGSASRRT